MTATSPWIELSIPERRPVRRIPHGTGALTIGVLLAALLLSALRIHVTELRYQRADALEEERRLGDEHRGLTAEVQGQRTPIQLQALARAQGFVTPERVIELPGRTAAR